jgi:hypothetical protein
MANIYFCGIISKLLLAESLALAFKNKGRRSKSRKCLQQHDTPYVQSSMTYS